MKSGLQIICSNFFCFLFYVDFFIIVLRLYYQQRLLALFSLFNSQNFERSSSLFISFSYAFCIVMLLIFLYYFHFEVKHFWVYIYKLELVPVSFSAFTEYPSLSRIYLLFTPISLCYSKLVFKLSLMINLHVLSPDTVWVFSWWMTVEGMTVFVLHVCSNN